MPWVVRRLTVRASARLYFLFIYLLFQPPWPNDGTNATEPDWTEVLKQDGFGKTRRGILHLLPRFPPTAPPDRQLFHETLAEMGLLYSLRLRLGRGRSMAPCDE
ncbi:hypothetical protein BT67DRAFT_148333 [Trichocladium antarcticum]|uniref:Uncharacterized protein n=1 Tax=Trichocladium antarcticum TaxID=1450529 RepID=A0AAN6UEZ6_9PEZI|nr:hypothetical protein BT67DRAFT_148333 [Trichocladium antarcticum]